jgi:hypothetical protein
MKGQIDDVHLQIWSQQHCCGKWRTFMEPQKAMSIFEGVRTIELDDFI